MLSIHQSALLNALADSHQVVLVVQTQFEQERHDSGWDIPLPNKLQVEVAPSERRIIELIDAMPEATHIFSGIDAYPLVFNAFKKCVRQRRHIMVYAEPYQVDGLCGKLRRLKYALLHLKYGKHIQALLATGQFGVKAYQKAGWQKSKIFEWGYFTESQPGKLIPEDAPNLHDESSLPRLLFVGRLDDNKRILPLIREVRKLRSTISSFTIIGTGPLVQEVQQLIKEDSRFCYLGTQTNAEVKQIMNQHDLLILPSQYDGWGAVVNEALQQGMRVLCSDHCGASSLLDELTRGGKFSWHTPDSLAQALSYWISKGRLNPRERQKITAWAHASISGHAAASYVEDIIQFLHQGSRTRPTPPWQKKGVAL